MAEYSISPANAPSLLCSFIYFSINSLGDNKLSYSLSFP